MSETRSIEQARLITNPGHPVNPSQGMSKQLVIVESPAKAKTINQYLGSDYVVEASVGHIRDLPKSAKGQPVPGLISTTTSSPPTSSPPAARRC